MRKIECIGILTSGGDAPGMNAAIRAVTRAAIANGFRVMGIYRGYEGLINNEIQEFTTENVSNIIQRGGTILKTARSKDFQTPEGRQRAYENMTARGIDALGEVTVRIQAEDGRVFTGRGSDNDIVVSSAKAYVNAINRMIQTQRSNEGK